MILKTNLHLHTNDDPQDKINYSFYQMIDVASALGFRVLALTCHNKIIFSQAYSDYAAAKNILLIPGIEKTIENKHVVILNPAPEAETLKSFAALADYRRRYPASFILAPHPFFYSRICLKEKLIVHPKLFDAIEYSWFYARFFNCNKKAESFAKSHNLPFIATSDTHDLKFLETSYALIESKTKQPIDIFNAIRQKRFTNFSQPRKFLTEILPLSLKMIFKELIKIDKAARAPYTNKYVRQYLP